MFGLGHKKLYRLVHWVQQPSPRLFCASPTSNSTRAISLKEKFCNKLEGSREYYLSQYQIRTWLNT